MKDFNELCETCPIRQTDEYINVTGDNQRAEYPRIRSLAAARFLCRAGRGTSTECPTSEEAVQNMLETFRKAEVERLRVEWLWGSAQSCHTVQRGLMGVFRRGWAEAMTQQDNRTRVFIGLPPYSRPDSPVISYINFVNGQDQPIEDIYERLQQKFGEPTTEAVRDAVLSRLSIRMSDGINFREAWVPAAEFTFAAFCLDDDGIPSGYDLGQHFDTNREGNASSQT